MDLKHKPKDLLELNPYAKVPVLVDDGGVIYESNIINEYLEEAYPEIRLLPKDLKERAKARIWMDYCNSRLHATASGILHGPDKDKAKKSMGEYLETIESALAGREYLAGDYSLADVTFIPFFVRRQRYQVEIENLPRISRWMERMLERPAVKSTL